jgi:hypothetical protein
VALTGPAPPEGLVVTLGSDQPAVATPPAAVVIPAGALSASFVVATSPVTAPVSITIAATGLGVTRTAMLRVLPVGLARFSLDLNRVPRGRPVRGTVTLIGPAPAAGVPVILVNDHPSAVRQPERVVVPGGATSITFPITSYRVRRTVRVRLVATVDGDSRTAVLAVMPGGYGRR